MNFVWMDQKEWFAEIEALRLRATMPNFHDICRLAATSPQLHMAFAAKRDGRVDAEAVKNHIAQEIEIAHGLKRWLADEFQHQKIQIESVIAQSESSLLHFDALKLSAGRVLSRGVVLNSALADWLAEYLLGNISAPNKSKGPDAFMTMERDLFNCSFLSWVKTLRYPITENDGSFTNSSACHAISETWAGRGIVPSVKRLKNIWSER